MRIALAAALAAIALLSACGSEQPSARDKACAEIKVLTPGSVELGWAVKTLSDRSATQPDRLDAMKMATYGFEEITKPYTCDGPVFERYAAEYAQRH